MIILRPKNVIFERLWLLSKFHFLACSTLYIRYQGVETGINKNCAHWHLERYYHNLA